MVGGHRVPGTLLGYLQEHLESRVGKEYRCTFVDHPKLFLSFLNVLHGGSLFQRMVPSRHRMVSSHWDRFGAVGMFCPCVASLPLC